MTRDLSDSHLSSASLLWDMTLVGVTPEFILGMLSSWWVLTILT